MLLPYLIALSLSYVAYGQGPCKRVVGNCACEIEGGWINLEPLDTKDKNNPRFKDSTDFNNDKYSYNPCSDFTYGGCSNVAICQSRPDLSYPVGTQSSARFGSDSSTGKVTLTYDATGDDNVKRTGIVTITCDQNEEGKLDVNGEFPEATYNFALSTKYACPGVAPAPGGGGGLSPGSILLIVFFVLLFVYFVGGILFNKYVKGAEGKELIPQYLFWMALPGLALEGVRFTIGRIKGLVTGGGGGKSSYDEF